MHADGVAQVSVAGTVHEPATSLDGHPHGTVFLDDCLRAWVIGTGVDGGAGTKRAPGDRTHDHQSCAGPRHNQGASIDNRLVDQIKICFSYGEGSRSGIY